jgi:hypothetical protein
MSAGEELHWGSDPDDGLKGELDDTLIATLISFFRLLDTWDRDGEHDAKSVQQVPPTG